MEMSYIISPKEKIMNAILFKEVLKNRVLIKLSTNLITDCI